MIKISFATFYSFLSSLLNNLFANRKEVVKNTKVRGSAVEHVTESEALVSVTIERPTSSENNLRQFVDVFAKRVHRSWLTRRVSADGLLHLTFVSFVW